VTKSVDEKGSSPFWDLLALTFVAQSKRKSFIFCMMWP